MWELVRCTSQLGKCLEPLLFEALGKKQEDRVIIQASKILLETYVASSCHGWVDVSWEGGCGL